MFLVIQVDVDKTAQCISIVVQVSTQFCIQRGELIKCFACVGCFYFYFGLAVDELPQRGWDCDRY